MSKLWQATKLGGVAALSVGLEKVSKGLGKRFLLNSLQGMPGLPAKAAQMLGGRLGDPNEAAPEPLDVETFRAILREKAPKLLEQIAEIKPVGMRASIGQAHQALLKDGRNVCIKAQIPGVDKVIFDQLELLLKASEMGPVRKYGMDMPAYRSFLTRKIQEELDYENEALQQTEAHRVYGRDLIIPTVIPELSGKTVLVQSYEAGLSLAEFSGSAGIEARLRAAESLSRLILSGIFRSEILHADLHPGNFAFQPDGRVIVYDFGSTLRLEKTQSQALLALVRSYTGSGPALSPFEVFVFLGFDAGKLSTIGSRMPALCAAMLEPLTAQRAFSAKDYDLSESFEKILGNDAWWFRTAGSPWFLYVIRVVAGLMSALRSLDVTIPLARLFQDMTADLSTQDLHIPSVLAPGDVRASTQAIAQSLRVSVWESSREVVSLTFPARAVDQIEELLPEAALSIFTKGASELSDLKTRVQRSGYLPQILFDKSGPTRHYKVWLE